MYNVQLVLDSVNARGVRLCTWLLEYPRFVHSELMTHRLFSRNAASSRAIPVARMLEKIERDPVLPKFWGKNQSGMQAAEELSDTQDGMHWYGSKPDKSGVADSPRARAERRWLEARTAAVAAARDLSELGLHKQIANRVTEPWMFIATLVSTTFHANWFALRDHGAAQPELAWVAKVMHQRYEESRPTFVPPGSWHRPFLTGTDTLRLIRMRSSASSAHDLNLASAGRCAAVSYDNLGEGVDLDKDIARARRMMDARPLHASPFEHVAQARFDDHALGNFEGWTQLRKCIPDEAGPPEPRFRDDVPLVFPKPTPCACWDARIASDMVMGRPGCPACSGTGQVPG